MMAAVVTWVSAIILVVVFMLQQFGTHRVSWLFSPILLAWFVTTPLVGIYNIAAHYPSVFKAVSPHYIIKYFIRNKKQGWVALGGAVLCITGVSYLPLRLNQVDMVASSVPFLSASLCSVYRSRSNVCRSWPFQ
jgi:KUP system potassium uptake protein